MKAIILAAGRSTRLYPLTLDKPKCLLDLGGKTILQHQIDLLQHCGVQDVIVVTGYRENLIREAVGNNSNNVTLFFYPDFAKTNNLFTLWHVREVVDDDFICLFSDVVFGEELLKKLICSPVDFSLLVHTRNILGETMRVRMKDDAVCDIGSHISVNNGAGNFIGVAKFSKRAALLLIQEIEKLVRDQQHVNAHYTIALNALITGGEKIKPVFVDDDPWIEIDFVGDYEKAKNEIYPMVRLL